MNRKRYYIFIDFLLVPLLGILMLSDYIAGYYLEYLLKDNESINVQSVKVNIFTGSLNARKISFDHSDDSGDRYVGTIDIARISGISLKSVLSGEPTGINKVEIVHPLIQIHDAGPVTADSLVADTVGLDKWIEKINRLFIREGAVKYIADGGDTLFLDNINFNCENILPGYKNDEGLMPVSSFDIHTGPGRYKLKNGLYAIETNAIRFNSTDYIIELDSLHLLPRYSKKEFDDKVGDQTDRIEMWVDEAKMVMNVNYLFLKSDSLICSLHLKNGNINVYRDKRMPRKPGRYKKPVQEYLSEMDEMIRIDSLVMTSFDIIYEEHDEDASKAGKVKFTHLDATLKNILTRKQEDGELLLSADAGFMDSGKLSANITFPYGQKYFDCRGTLSGLPLKELNALSAPNGDIFFSSGAISRMDFNFRGDTDSSRGDLLLQYRNLDFAVADKKTGDTTSLKSKVISFVASDILVSDNNKTENGKPEQGKISYARDRERFIFNYIFKSLLSGIVSSISPTGNSKAVNKEKGRKSGKKN